MDSNSPLARAETTHEQTLTAGHKEYGSPLHETQEGKASSSRPPSRPSSVLPNILSSFGSSPTTSSHTKRQTPERKQEDILESKNSPLKSPTAHSDTCPSTPICGVPPYSPQSDRSSCGSASATAPQQFCLRWNNYQSNLTSVFDQLLQNESFVDVTLACDGRSIKAHKMVLSACSPYFQTLFSTTPCQHPIVIMRDVNWFELKSIVDFMYKGEINVSQEQIGPLLRIAEMLKVRGLADVSNLGSSANTAQLSTLQTAANEKDLYSSQTLLESPKRSENLQSPTTKRPPSQSLETDPEHCEQVRDISSLNEVEKKSRLEASEWDISGSVKTSESSNLELRLSPLQHQHLLGRNIRKRRWPSADAIFNPPESPLSSLIAAERAEQERERERTREREREKAREITLFTPPIPVTSCSSGNTSSLNTSALETTVHMDITSPSPTPTPNLLPPARTPSGMLTPSPHLQLSHHHSHQPHQSHRSSPASSVTSTHPSSILSRPLTPSPASVSHTGSGSRLEGSQMTGDSSHRFSMGPAQAAAMAAAAAQMDLGAGPSMGMRPHSSSGPPMPTGPGHHTSSLVDDLEIKPGIAEMIREEERFYLYSSRLVMTKSASSLITSFSIYFIICIVEFALAIEWNKVKPMYLVSMYPAPPSMRQDNNSLRNEPVVLNLEKETMPDEMITKEAMNRIFGGNEAHENSFTYQVGFLLQRPRGLYWCGGSLISHDFVLTAAHCVDMASRALVFLGAHDIKNANEPGQIRMMVFHRDFIIYPTWNPRRLKDDIALVRLPRSVKYNERIQPIQLPRKDYEYRSFEDKLGIASGWGRYATGVHAISNILRFVQLRIVNGQTCKNSFPLSYRNTNICTSGRYQKSTCNGDSGGPLVLQRRTSKRRVLIGVTSFGSIFGCDRGYPAAFTKVASYLDWIWDETGINPNVDLSQKYNIINSSKNNVREKKKKKFSNLANKNVEKAENIGVIDTRLRKYPDAELF